MKASSSSVLKKQKPKRRIPLHKMLRYLRIAFAMLILALTAWCWRGLSTLSSQTWQDVIGLLHPSHMIVTAHPDEIVRVGLLRRIERDVHETHHLDLQSLGKVLGARRALSRLHLFRLDGTRLLVRIRERRPILRLEEQGFYVSEDYTVYHEPGVTSPILPLLVGVVGAKAPLEIGQLRRVFLNEEQSTAVRHAVELLTMLEKKSMRPSEIRYDRYRGFSAILEFRQIEVVLGREPFHRQLERLVDVLRQMSDQKMQAKRIELDYSGKAFVQRLNE